MSIEIKTWNQNIDTILTSIEIKTLNRAWILLNTTMSMFI